MPDPAVSATAPPARSTQAHDKPMPASGKACLRYEFGLFSALWLRDMLHLVQERSRWLGVVLQPLMFWFILGSGMAGSFHTSGSAGGAGAGSGGEDYLRYFFPGSLVLILLFTSIFATISVVEDRKEGFLQAVLVAPGSRSAMVLGKVAGVTTMTIIQVALFVLFAPLAGFPLGGISWLLLLPVVILTCVGLTAVGFAMAWILDSAQAYHAVMSIVLLPLWVLSGAMFPASGSWVGIIATANPMTYSVSGVRAALGGTMAGGAGPAASLAVLLAFAVLSLAWAIRITARKH